MRGEGCECECAYSGRQGRDRIQFWNRIPTPAHTHTHTHDETIHIHILPCSATLQLWAHPQFLYTHTNTLTVHTKDIEPIKPYIVHVNGLATLYKIFRHPPSVT